MSAVLSAVDEDYGLDRQLAQLRVPPHSAEAESSVLGGLLLDNSSWDRVSDLLTESDFYRFEHRLVFGAIGALVNAAKPADVITVFEHLQNQGKAEEIGGLAYLNSLAQYVPSSGNIRRYAEIVRERGILRKLVSACACRCVSWSGLVVGVGGSHRRLVASPATQQPRSRHAAARRLPTPSWCVPFCRRRRGRAGRAGCQRGCPS